MQSYQPGQMLGKPGFCMVPEIKRLDADIIRHLGEFPVAIIGDGLGRRAIMDAGIKPLDASLTMVGTAVTVEVHPADNLMIHAALRIAREGDVLVINAHGDLGHGIWGELTTRMAIRKKLAGIVIDGAVRDSRELSTCGLPIFVRGVNPTGGSKDGPGQINMPTSCGGVAVLPGDVVVGDADGVIVVPAAQANAAIGLAEARIAAETKRMKAIKDGPAEGIYPDWLIPTLRKSGVLADGDEL